MQIGISIISATANAKLIEFNSGFFLILLNFVIIFLVAKKLFFKKFEVFLDNRSKGIAFQINEAERLELEAKLEKEKYEKKMESLKEEGRLIISEANNRAELQYDSIISEAEAKAKSIIKSAEAELEQEKIKAINALKDEISSIAIYAAEKIIEKQIDEKTNREMVDKIIEEVGDAKWEN